MHFGTLILINYSKYAKYNINVYLQFLIETYY